MKIIDDDGQVIAEGQVLTLKPGDVVVFQTKKRLNIHDKEGIAAQLGRMFPDNKGTVLDEGADLNIVRPAVKGAL